MSSSLWRSSCAISGSSESSGAATLQSTPIQPRWRPAYEHQQLLRDRGIGDRLAEYVRAAGWTCNDRGLNPLPAPRRARLGNGGRAAPKRHVFELPPPRDPAVYPRRRIHEQRRDHGPTLDLL